MVGTRKIKTRIATVLSVVGAFESERESNESNKKRKLTETCKPLPRNFMVYACMTWSTRNVKVWFTTQRSLSWFGNHRLLFAACTTCLFLMVVCSTVCNANDDIHCATSCGNIRNISYPFRLKGDPKECGKKEYELACENNITLLYYKLGRYYVEAINYKTLTIRLVDSCLDNSNCSTLLLCSSRIEDFYYQRPYPIYTSKEMAIITHLTSLKCSNKVESVRYMDANSCLNQKNSSYHFYVVVGWLSVSQVEVSCSVENVSMILSTIEGDKYESYMDIHKELVYYGFEVSWFHTYCGNCPYDCYMDGNNKVLCHHLPPPDKYVSVLGFINTYVEGPVWRNSLVVFCLHLWVIIAIWRLVIGFFVMPCVMAFLIYRWRRRHLSMYENIEEFLQNNNNLMPIRYSYYNIKKMTNGFKDKLGEGGYGTVYKAKLRSGYFAAVKIMGKSKSNGQDFINEVATIGRIHHCNVVRLIGFCVEGTKRALVYDFMPNGSLDKYIFSQEGYISLSWERLYEISLGVARGIEYLHRGCEMQILHFDIKPHNILLDENYNPKVSDFGLAKLFPTDGTSVSLTAARGTMGYIAPELFYKNIGRISYKADVYSFGMLLMEIAGRRKNLNTKVDHSSQIYFPLWVYDRVVDNQDIEIGDATEEEEKTAKKMIIVALWCIQMRPCDRPSMNKVIEMLEGEVDSLKLPPKPVLYPNEQIRENEGSTNQTRSSNVSDDSIDTISLIVDAGEC